MKYGYYLAATNERFGDPEYSAIAACHWARHSPRERPFARCEGASAWVDDEGVEHYRLIMRDIFSDATVQYKGHVPYNVPKYKVF
jgi:hypothetical protein